MKLDTYPIYDKNGKPDYFKLALMLVVVILAILLIRSCNKDVPTKPVVITGKEVHDTIVSIDKEKQHLTDSFNNIISKQDRDIIRYKTNYDDLLAEYLNIQNETQTIITKAVYPDTCKPVVDLLTGQFLKLKNTSEQKDKAAANTINSLTTQNRTKDKFLASKDSSYKRLKAISDTCASALTQLEKYAKKIKPKREISIGISGMTNYVNLSPVVGLGIGYRTRKGLQFDANVYSNQTITVGIKKSLIRF